MRTVVVLTDEDRQRLADGMALISVRLGELCSATTAARDAILAFKAAHDLAFKAAHDRQRREIGGAR